MEEQVEVAHQSRARPPQQSVQYPHRGRGWAWIHYARSTASFLAKTYFFSCDPRMKQRFGARAPHTATVRRPESGAAPGFHMLSI